MVDSAQISPQALATLQEAALAVVGNLSLETVLRQIVESARTLAGARYAALGVPDSSGRLLRFIHSGLEPEIVAEIGHLPEGRGLLGAILDEGKTIRIPRIVADPRFAGFPPGHPPMGSFLGVPIRIANEIVGNLYLADKVDGDEFTEVDQELIELLAAHAAIALNNARLYEQVEQLAVVEERSRIGMDLHDGVIQSIYAVGLGLESTRLMLSEDELPAVAKSIETAIDGLNDAIRDIRNFILDLRPRRFEGNLNRGFSRLVRDFQANAMAPVELKVDEAAVDRLPLPLAGDVFLTVQEALANIARHARATEVKITANREGNSFILCVQDNGVGFNVDQQIYTIGHGLANMRARAEAWNGALTLESEPGQGTTIRLSVPIAQNS